MQLCSAARCHSPPPVFLIIDSRSTRVFWPRCSASPNVLLSPGGRGSSMRRSGTCTERAQWGLEGLKVKSKSALVWPVLILVSFFFICFGNSIRGKRETYSSIQRTRLSYIHRRLVHLLTLSLDIVVVNIFQRPQNLTNKSLWQEPQTQAPETIIWFLLWLESAISEGRFSLTMGFFYICDKYVFYFHYCMNDCIWFPVC